MAYFKKWLLGALAVGGAASLIAFAYVAFLLPKCQITRQQDIRSPDGVFAARIQGRVCADASETRAVVYLGRVSDSQWNVATEVHAQPFDIDVRWGDPVALTVSVPSEASAQRFGLPTEWPRVSVVKTVVGKASQ